MQEVVSFFDSFNFFIELLLLPFQLLLQLLLLFVVPLELVVRHFAVKYFREHVDFIVKDAQSVEEIGVLVFLFRNIYSLPYVYRQLPIIIISPGILLPLAAVFPLSWVISNIITR